MLGIRRRPVLLAAAGALGVSLVYGAGPAAGANAAMSQPGSALSPSPSNHNTLLGVGADSATDAWAVGWDLNESAHLPATLILHWDGTAWSQVPSPNPGADGSVLTGVRVLSATDAWAVGDERSSSFAPTKTLILHWNGTAWSRVPSPNPSATTNELTGVTAVSGTDAWAAGDYGTAANPQAHTLLLHWNGTAWSKVKSPNPSTPGQFQQNALTAVSADSPTDAWAVGVYTHNVGQFSIATLTLHWNGTSWSKVKSPNPDHTFFLSSLSGVSAVSPTSAWAAGEYYKTPSGPGMIGVILHWNGTTWSRVNSPHPGRSFDQLLGVSADSPTDAWAAGNYGQPDSPTQTLALHWNGTAWPQASSPSPSGGDNQLNAVTALSPTDAWAVGEYSNTSAGYNTLILHWNGMSWSQT